MPAIIEIEQLGTHTMKRKRDSSAAWPGSDELAMKISRYSSCPFLYILVAVYELTRSSHQNTLDRSITHTSPGAQRRVKSLPQPRMHDSKRQRIISTSSCCPQTQSYQFSAPTSPREDTVSTYLTTRPSMAARAVTSDLDLRPCHLCHRQPRKRKDLEGFISCEGCSLRSCFVCIRECHGLGGDTRHDVRLWQGREGSNMTRNDLEEPPEAGRNEDDTAMSFEVINPTMEDAPILKQYGGENAVLAMEEGGWTTQHRSIVCSRCCIEKGADGEVVCLGCIRAGGDY